MSNPYEPSDIKLEKKARDQPRSWVRHVASGGAAGLSGGSLATVAMLVLSPIHFLVGLAMAWVVGFCAGFLLYCFLTRPIGNRVAREHEQGS